MKTEKEKLAWAYKKEYDELWDQVYKSPRVELPVPVYVGYVVSLDLREDVKKSERGQRIMEILPLIDNSRNYGKGAEQKARAKNTNVVLFSVYFTSIGIIDPLHNIWPKALKESEYLALDDKYKPLFYKREARQQGSYRNSLVVYYELDVRRYELRTKVRKRYQTHTREVPPELEARLNFLWDAIYGRPKLLCRYLGDQGLNNYENPVRELFGNKMGVTPLAVYKRAVFKRAPHIKEVDIDDLPDTISNVPAEIPLDKVW